MTEALQTLSKSIASPKPAGGPNSHHSAGPDRHAYKNENEIFEESESSEDEKGRDQEKAEKGAKKD